MPESAARLMARVEEDSMAPLGVSSSDRRRYAHARQQGKARLADRSMVLDARYDSVTDFIELKFTGSGSTSIPRSFVPGLARRSRSKMRSLAVSPAGDALSWPSLDIECMFQGCSSARSVRASSRYRRADAVVGVLGPRPRAPNRMERKRPTSKRALGVDKRLSSPLCVAGASAAR